MARGNPNTMPPDVTDKREEVSTAISAVQHFAELPPVRKNDTQECRKRISAYFDFCRESGIVPTVEGLCSALRLTRQTLNVWEHDSNCLNGSLVAQAKTDISAFLTQLSVNGAINPVFPMFLLKCNNGYSETQGIQIEVKQDTVKPPKSREAIAAELGEFVTDEQVDSADFPPLPEI